MANETLFHRILRMRDLRGKTGLCPSATYALIAQGKFPKPFSLIPGGRAVGWFEADIDAWLETRKAEGGAA